MTAAFYRVDGDALILSVRVQPGARRDEIVEVRDGVLRIRLRAAAIEGRANEALCAFLAERLGTAKSRVRVLQGESSRSKRVAVSGARRAPETLVLSGKNAG
jgi:uncharacterized protein